ncbi:MAG TPA: hypothetical protein VMU17_03155, partial [Elusimicrobiota bacterium]|nr:hypothetical protein [Elusimicrobiota bacterium]
DYQRDLAYFNRKGPLPAPAGFARLSARTQQMIRKLQEVQQQFFFKAFQNRSPAEQIEVIENGYIRRAQEARELAAWRRGEPDETVGGEDELGHLRAMADGEPFHVILELLQFALADLSHPLNSVAWQTLADFLGEPDVEQIPDKLLPLLLLREAELQSLVRYRIYPAARQSWQQRHPAPAARPGTALTHPDTIKAAKIRLRVGRWGFLRWFFSSDRAALERGDRYRQAIDHPLIGADLDWAYKRFTRWYLPEYWNILWRPIAFAVEHENYVPETDSFEPQTAEQQRIRSEAAYQIWDNARTVLIGGAIAAYSALTVLDLTDHAAWLSAAAGILTLFGGATASYFVHGWLHGIHQNSPERLVDKAYLTFHRRESAALAPGTRLLSAA